MKLLDCLLPRRHGPCVHSWCEDSTLRIGTISALGSNLYYVYCRECGASTDTCLTKEEAVAKAERGMMR